MLRSEVPKMCHKPTVCRHVDHPEAKSWAVRTQGIIYFGKGWACVEDVCLFVCVFVCYCVWGKQLMHLTLPHLIAHQASRQPGSHSHKNTLHPFPHKPHSIFQEKFNLSLQAADSMFADMLIIYTESKIHFYTITITDTMQN